MSGKAMSLKATMRNLAKKKNMSAQVVLQNFMFECFLVRLSQSVFKEKFILKGGLLIAALVDIANRSTMDMDVTIKNYPMDAGELTKAMRNICSVSVQDDISFTFTGIKAIRDDDAYGGYRVSLQAVYDSIKVPMQIDITTGDVITPSEVFYSYKMNFNDGIIGVWTYNIETVIAEKVETILRRGTYNTRPRDFYDVYILTKTQNFKYTIFQDALIATAAHRESSYIFTSIRKRVHEMEENATLKSRWDSYRNNYQYAQDITYEDVMNALVELIEYL
nr:nucleotidyl transferase AbiEii/AbiGii toxin family protein [uncultured Sphaerochaeta sp.]